MSNFDFVEKVMCIGSDNTSPIQFYKRGFNLGGSTTPSLQDIILSGNTALTLTNALANGLNYLKVFGGTEQNGTPTPDAPMDIVCNKGVVKVRKKSGLPSGYQAVEYLESTGTQYIDTGYNAISNTIVKAKLYTDEIGNKNWFGGRGMMPKMGFSFNSFSPTEVEYMRGTNSWTKVSANNVVGTPFTLEFAPTYININEQKVADITTKNSTDTKPLYLFAKNGGTANISGRIYYLKILEDNNSLNKDLIRNLIPCRRNLDNVLGMYDTKSGNFFTNAGTGTFIAGQDINDLEIYTVGTTEAIEIDTAVFTATAEMLLKVETYQDVQSVIDGSVTRNVGIKVLDGTEDWTESTQNIVITGATAAWGAVAGVGGYCTHLTVLKSGETTFAGSCRFAGDFNIYAYKTAFGVNDGTQFKQYLADQYANGTPVIVVYPLAESITETVRPQPMNIQAGTNIVEITQASIDNLGLEVSYKATV